VHRHEKGVDLVTQGSNGQRFHRTLFGYRRRDVDATLAELRSRVQELEAAADPSGVVSRHLGELLTRFATAVDEGEREAQAAADSLVQEARTEAAALFETARTSYEAHVGARRSAMSQLEGALGQMTDALSALASVPDFPPIPASVAVAKVDDALEAIDLAHEHERTDLVA
jgi:cell division septum initiation protein DivIVA